MVSVIVPTYNHEKYIRKALDSILMQEVPFLYEILIGDDASCDETQDILHEYQERYPDKIRLFLHKENIGATRNSYELLTNAKGRYLATLEGMIIGQIFINYRFKFRFWKSLSRIYWMYS